MAVEKYIRGKKDDCSHHGRRSEVRRLAESNNQLKEYMSHERYTPEDRTRVPFRNEEWHALSGRENRMPNQFGQPDAAVVFVYGLGEGSGGFRHTNHHGEAFIVPGVNCDAEEASQLAARGAVFPLEIAQPVPAASFETEAQWLKPIHNLSDDRKNT